MIVFGLIIRWSKVQILQGPPQLSTACGIVRAGLASVWQCTAARACTPCCWVRTCHAHPRFLGGFDRGEPDPEVSLVPVVGGCGRCGGRQCARWCGTWSTILRWYGVANPSFMAPRFISGRAPNRNVSGRAASRSSATFRATPHIGHNCRLGAVRAHLPQTFRRHEPDQKARAIEFSNSALRLSVRRSSGNASGSSRPA